MLHHLQQAPCKQRRQGQQPLEPQGESFACAALREHGPCCKWIAAPSLQIRGAAEGLAALRIFQFEDPAAFAELFSRSEARFASTMPGRGRPQAGRGSA